MRSQEDSVRLVDPLLNWRPERVELGEAPALLVGKQHPNAFEALFEPGPDPLTELVKTFTRFRRDLECTRVSICEPAAPERVHQVDLVDHELHRHVRGADLGQDPFDRSAHLVELLVGRRTIDQVEDEIGHEGLLERRGEALDQLVRQAADEAHRVGQQVLAAVDLEAAGGRVERFEKTVTDGDVGAGESVQERRLPGIRVSGQRDDGRLGAPAGLPAGGALSLEGTQPAAQDGDPAAREPPVRLELSLAWASRADTAPEPLEMLPEPAHARQVVLELRELDLQLSFGGDRVLREDVEDQLRPVDHPRLEGVLELTLLHRRELVVDKQRLCARTRKRLLQLDELPFSNVGARSRPGRPLDELADRLDTSGAGEFLQLGKLPAGVDPLRQHCDDEPALGLGTRCRVRLA